ncbi:MAG: nuclease, partial [Pseudomonadota bacterium]
MAKVFPDGWRELSAKGAAERGSYAIFGEIDHAIVGPTGRILLIEQKAGLLSETPGGLAKKYAGK